MLMGRWRPNYILRRPPIVSVFQQNPITVQKCTGGTQFALTAGGEDRRSQVAVCNRDCLVKERERKDRPPDDPSDEDWPSPDFEFDIAGCVESVA